jgi:hypothetical protein
MSRQATDFTIYPSGRHPHDVLTIPTLHWVGWFDNLLPFSMRDYQALCARPDRAPLQYLLADATDHEAYHLDLFPMRPQDDHEIDPDALERVLPQVTAPALDFFDVFLRGCGDAAALPRVRWFLSHDGWRESPVWPPPGVRDLQLHLASAHLATSGATGGSLSPVAERTRGEARWVHDPQHLVASALVDPFSQLKEWPDEREVEAREDVLTFTSEPLATPLDLAGPVTARLALGSSAGSMHVLVKLLDADPDGCARLLARGQARVVKPDPQRLVCIDLSHSGYRMRPGHSLRLHVACSDFPLYLWHPGTEEDPWSATQGVANQQLLVTGGEPGSCVSLTVLDGAR